MKQTRRDLLRTIGTVGTVGVAGCSALREEFTAPPSDPSASDPTDTPPPDSTDPTRTPHDPLTSRTSTEAPTRTDAPVSPTPTRTNPGALGTETPTATTAPTTIPFEFAPEVIVAQPTAETPPILRIQVTNTDESAHGLSTAYNEFPIPINGASNDSHHIQLIPESQIEAVVWPDTAPACWKSTVLPREPLRHSERIDGGGSLTGEYALLPVAPQSEELPACWLAGTYRFSQQYWLDAANVDGVTETPTQIDEHTGERFQWVLEIQITDQQTVTVVSSTTQLD